MQVQAESGLIVLIKVDVPGRKADFVHMIVMIMIRVIIGLRESGLSIDHADKNTGEETE
jgi:hypothetical protein